MVAVLYLIRERVLCSALLLRNALEAALSSALRFFFFLFFFSMPADLFIRRRFSFSGFFCRSTLP